MTPTKSTSNGRTVYLVNNFDSLSTDSPISPGDLTNEQRYDMLFYDKLSNKRLDFEGGRLPRDVLRRISGLDPTRFDVYVMISSRQQPLNADLTINLRKKVFAERGGSR